MSLSNSEDNFLSNSFWEDDISPKGDSDTGPWSIRVFSGILDVDTGGILMISLSSFLDIFPFFASFIIFLTYFEGRGRNPKV